MKENIKCPAVASTNMSMLGKGNSSLGQVLLRSRKSIQHLLWPFFFITETIFASHVGCWIGLIKPTSSSFWISCLIWIYNSGLKLRGGCLTGLVPFLMFSLWVTSLESGSGVSLYVQAKTSQNSRRSARILSFNSSKRHVLRKMSRGSSFSSARFTSTNSSP